MIGTFTTTAYASRQDLILRRPSGVYVSTNRFTDAGLEWMWNMMLGNLRDAETNLLTDQLSSARLVVGTGDAPFSPLDARLAGDSTAQAPMDTGYPIVTGMVQGDEGRDACRLTLRATFGEQDGNFDWAERGVVTAQGVLLDRSVEDQGRKVLGAVWTLEAALDLDR